MDLKTITYEVEESVAVVTLNRPDRLNAWTARMAAEYRWALQRADRDVGVRVVVVTGAGRGFCAGADFSALNTLAAGTPYQAEAELDHGAGATAGADGGQGPASGPWQDVRPDFTHEFSFPAGLAKPVIAAVNGAAAGVGFILMCFADVRFAAAGAKFTTAFARLGLPAEHGLSWMLTRLVGPGHAADVLLSARVFLAEEAAEMGLVNRVLPAEEVLPFTLDYARTMARDCSPASLRVIKRQMWDDLVGGLDASARHAVEQLNRMLGEPDFAEGVAAFQEKRPPRWGGT